MKKTARDYYFWVKEKEKKEYKLENAEDETSSLLLDEHRTYQPNFERKLSKMIFKFISGII